MVGMISCKKSTELIEKRNLTGLTLRESVSLVIHMAMCDACRHYSRHSRIIARVMKKESGTDTGSQPENPALKQRILDHLKNK